MSKRIAIGRSQRIAEVRHIRTRHFQVRRTQERGVHGQLGIGVLNLYLWRSELRPLELGQFTLRRRRQGMVVRPASASGFLCARGQFRDVGRQIDGRNIDGILRLDRWLEPMRKNRHDQQGDETRVQRDRNRLRPAEVLVLRPDISHLDRLAGYPNRWQFCRKEKLLDAVAEAPEPRAPPYSKPAVDWPFRNRARAQKLLQVVPKIVGNEVSRRAKSGNGGSRHRNNFL